MEKMKLNIQLFGVNINTNSLTVVANSYNATNKTIQVKYLVKLTTTSSSYNNHNITTTYYIDGIKYTKTHKLPKTSTTTVAEATATIPCPYPRKVSANFSCPTDISAGTVTGSDSVNISPAENYKARIKKNLPTGYTLREYITGNASYIETNYYPNSTTKIVACYQFNSVTPVQQRIFGEGGSDLCYCHYINGGGNWAWSSQNSDGNWTSTGVVADTNKHVFILDNKFNGVVLDDNSKYSAKMGTTHSNTSSVTLALGGYHNGDGSYSDIANMKIYYYYLYENDILIRAWIPCTRNSDGVAGLYDLINNIFYPSSSGTNYTAGPVVSGGVWIPGKLYYKNNGSWVQPSRFGAKKDGTWTYQINEYYI